MFFYYLYSILTAPGVVVHELSHVFFCVIAKVKIHKIKLFQFGKVAGFVIHDEPSKMIQAVLVSFGPLLINTFLTLICFAQLKIPYLSWHSAIYLWVGIAVGLHAIPSTGDAKSLLQTTNNKFWHNPFVVLAYPFVLVLYILNLLKRIHFDFVFVAALFWLAKYYLKAWVWAKTLNTIYSGKAVDNLL